MLKKTLIAIALASVAGVALAAVPFAEVDTNGDGYLSSEEAAAIEGLEFDDADVNGDGRLSPIEYAAATEE